MPITKTKEDSLVDTNITDVDIKAFKVDPEKEENIKEEPKRKVGFLKSVWVELKQAQWPSFKYVLTWGITVVIFTLVFSIFLGFFDNIFNSGIKFVECTSPQGANDSIVDCTPELVENLTFQTP
jgi:preprotein translocase SecE subunit